MDLIDRVWQVIDRVRSAAITSYHAAARFGGAVYHPPGKWFCRLTGMSNRRAAKEIFIVSTALEVYVERGTWVFVVISVVTLPVWLRLMDATADDVERTLAGATTVKRSSPLFEMLAEFLVIRGLFDAVTALIILVAARQWPLTLRDVVTQLDAIAVTLVFNPMPPSRSLVRDLADRMATRLSGRLRPA